MKGTRCISVLALLLSSSLSAQASITRIDNYREQIALDTKGEARVAISTRLTASAAGPIDLPLTVQGATDIHARVGNQTLASTVVKIGDTSFLRLELPGPLADAQVDITLRSGRIIDWSAKTPRGLQNVSYTFKNTGSVNIGTYDLKLVLPPDLVMNEITSSTPRATGEEVVPPYDFHTEGNQLVVGLHARAVPVASTGAIAFSVRERGGSPWPLVILAMGIGIFGLYLKRDVLTREDYTHETVG